MNDRAAHPVAALTNKKTELYITDLPAVVGRNDNSVDVYFFHESISREHCIFEFLNRRVTVRDLGSTVGTSINGRKLEPNTPYFIEDGAKIAIGKVKFVFHADYEEIARRERMKAVSAPAPAQAPAGGAAGQERGPKTFTVEARLLTEYEYDADEVIGIECGLRPEGKPLSFTAEYKKAEVEDELKKTQAITREEIQKEEEAAAAGPVPEEAEDLQETEETADETKEEKGAVLRLRWIDDETGETRKVTVDQFPFSMGRKSDENDYALRRKGISRKHMHFEESDGRIYVVDDASTNGVKLNGNKIKADERTEVCSGDKLSLGGITLTVSID